MDHLPTAPASLAAISPADVDNRLRSLASSLGVGLRLKTRTMFPSTGPSYDLVVGCEVNGSIAQAPAAAVIFERSFTQAPQAMIEAWLAELSVLIVRRPGDPFADALMVEAYAGRLTAWPADVVRAALLAKQPFWTFWPAWAELEAECNRLVAPRKVMLAALHNQTPTGEPEPPAPRVSPESATAILQSAGFTPKRFEAVAKNPMARNATEFTRNATEFTRNATEFTRNATELAREPLMERHWSETAPPDDPRWESVKAERTKNDLIRRARDDQARAAAKKGVA